MKMNKLRELYFRAQTMSPEYTLSILNPTLLYIGFILKFFFVGRWLPGATDPHLPWIYPAPEKSSLYLMCHLRIN